MPEEHKTQQEAERAVEELRRRFAPLIQRLSPEVEPAVVFRTDDVNNAGTEPRPRGSGLSPEPEK